MAMAATEKVLRRRDARAVRGRSAPRPARGPRSGAYLMYGPAIAIAWLRRRYPLREIAARVGLVRQTLWSLQRGRSTLRYYRAQAAVAALVRWAVEDFEAFHRAAREIPPPRP